jgi:HlyD family secretion protein
MEVDNNLSFERSELVQEIVSSKTGVVERYGIIFFIIVLIIILVSCWYIKYPDIVTAKAKLTSINTPKEVITKVSGKLVKLIIKEGDFVHQNQLLGFVESRANHDEVIKLSDVVDTLQTLLQNNQVEKIPVYFPFYFQNLGEIQKEYQTFMQSFTLFNQYLSSGYYVKKNEMLRIDIRYLEKIHGNLLQQKNMNKEDLDLAKETFEANKILKDEKVISRLDYRNEQSKLIGKSLTIPQISLAIINNESLQHEKQKEIMQLKNEITLQKGVFEQSLYTLKAQLEDWKSKYLLTAPIDGKIAFVTFLQENQQLQINQIICFVNPENTEYFAEVYVPQNNFGKLRIGQSVLLKFPAYPFQEFGTIKGKIEFISNIFADSGYLTKITLPEGLNTNYKKQLQFREGLNAQAEIQTQNMNLLKRFYYSIVKKI